MQLEVKSTIAHGTISSSVAHAASIEEVPATYIATARPQSSAEVETKVREYFSDIPIMVEIARCESTFRHVMNDGTVLRGFVDNDDLGVMQINLRFHAVEAERLGLDLENIYDNMAYARHLYERQGTQPWNASAPCWGRHIAMR